MASPWLPSKEATAEMGYRIRYALHSRHGGSVHAILSITLYNGQVYLPSPLGDTDSSVMVYPDLC